MSEPHESSEDTEAPVRESKSTLYLIGSSTLAAVILGLTIFLLVRGYQWNHALAALRAEPGIEVLGVERVGFFKKRILGLRDPLAASVEEILTKHNLGPNSRETQLTEYHSLNTEFAEQRAAATGVEIAKLKQSLVATVGEFAGAMEEKRQADLEKITAMLFEARFPEAMKTVEIEWREGQWWVEGELYAPQHEIFLSDAPDYIVEGEFNTSRLVNLTETRTSSLREDIETTDLSKIDLDGRPVHLERVARLIRDYDEVCDKSRMPLPQLRLEFAGDDEKAAETLRAELLKNPWISEERFSLATRVAAEGEPPTSIKLAQLPSE